MKLIFSLVTVLLSLAGLVYFSIRVWSNQACSAILSDPANDLLVESCQVSLQGEKQGGYAIAFHFRNVNFENEKWSLRSKHITLLTVPKALFADPFFRDWKSAPPSSNFLENRALNLGLSLFSSATLRELNLRSKDFSTGGGPVKDLKIAHGFIQKRLIADGSAKLTRLEIELAGMAEFLRKENFVFTTQIETTLSASTTLAENDGRFEMRKSSLWLGESALAKQNVGSTMTLPNALPSALFTGHFKFSQASQPQVAEADFNFTDVRFGDFENVWNIPLLMKKLVATGVAHYRVQSTEVRVLNLSGPLQTKDFRTQVEAEIKNTLHGKIDAQVLRTGLAVALDLPGAQNSKTIGALKTMGLSPEMIEGQGLQASVNLAKVIPDEIPLEKGTFHLLLRRDEAAQSVNPEIGLSAHSSEFDFLTEHMLIKGWHKTLQEAQADGLLNLQLAQVEDPGIEFQMVVRAPDFKPVLSLSAKETARLLEKFATVQLGEGVQVTVPSGPEIKSIEKAGKVWLENLLKKNETNVPSEKEEARKKMKDSEALLKEALGKFLGK